jgi:hypothetical protein
MTESRFENMTDSELVEHFRRHVLALDASFADVHGNNRIDDEELTPCYAALAARGNEALRKLTALACDSGPILQLRAAAYGFEADPETSRRVLLDLAKRRDLFAMFAWAALSHHDRQSTPPVSTLLQNIRGFAES